MACVRTLGLSVVSDEDGKSGAKKCFMKKNAKVNKTIQSIKVTCGLWLWGAAVGLYAQESGLENLGKNINSQYSEILPRISPDGSTLYFVREGHPKNYGAAGNMRDQDVWYSTRKGSDWELAKNIGPPINNAYPNAVNAVTADGNSLLLLNEYLPGGRSKTGVAITHRSKSGWSQPENMAVKKYYNDYIYGSFNLGADGKTLMIECQMRNGYGQNDLYVSFLEADGTWSEPLNLGQDVNTVRYEATPFLAPDGRTLYFATDGRGGIGSFDIFVTRRLDDSWVHWSTPENLGPRVNSTGFDAYFTIPASGEFAYLASNNNAVGETDIFRVKISQEFRPQPVVLIRGKVIDLKSKQPLEANIKLQRLSDGKEMARATTDPLTGEYKIILPAGETYGFYAEAKNYIGINDNLDVSQLKSYQEISRDLKLVPLEVGEKIPLKNIFFDTGKSELRPESGYELDRVAQILRERPTIKIEIGGHSDNQGQVKNNQKLSLERAERVRTYLIEKGAAAERIVAKGYGPLRPVSPNDTPQGRQENRRVELTVLEK